MRTHPEVRRRQEKRKYRRQLGKASSCAVCGFIPIHDEQLQVDHRDGDRFNNDRSNKWTLCANCHALKTALDAGRVVLKGPLPPVFVRLVQLLAR
jgi:5-methylcytosine-specific restriction endonuclease McrA